MGAIESGRMTVGVRGGHSSGLERAHARTAPAGRPRRAHRTAGRRNSVHALPVRARPSRSVPVV